MSPLLCGLMAGLIISHLCFRIVLFTTSIFYLFVALAIATLTCSIRFMLASRPFPERPMLQLALVIFEPIAKLLLNTFCPPTSLHVTNGDRNWLLFLGSEGPLHVPLRNLNACLELLVRPLRLPPWDTVCIFCAW